MARIAHAAPYVLPEDEASLDVYSKAANPSDTAYHLDLPPLPFQGRADAPIVLLGLNPGYSEANDEIWHKTPEFLEINQRNYRHDSTAEYPLFFLDPNIEGGSLNGGQNWWHRRLKPLRKAGYDDKLLARAFLSVQYVPYRSKSYKHNRKALESQKYGFDLVRQAVKRGALIIGLRSAKLWKEAVKELEGYERFCQLTNPRYPVLSEKQLGAEKYKELLDELNKLR
ncbi:hypothetical protein [Hymenobacter psoromatis]|uniref:hypothetical protein n=1 Tax=Hymenobacter psoromatis TaxID=1484116 RepID=UPI001CBB680E|nr:hypothetical protein [Hymenobacter psoromatis]